MKRMGPSMNKLMTTGIHTASWQSYINTYRSKYVSGSFRHLGHFFKFFSGSGPMHKGDIFDIPCRHFLGGRTTDI